MNENFNGVTGVTTLAILVLSFLMPGWAASALGLAGPHAHLVNWVSAQEGLFCLVLWLIYGLAGFGVLLAVAVAICAAGLALMRGLGKTKAWALQTGGAIARLLGLAMLWLAQILTELLWDAYATRVVRLAAWWHEQCELRRLYHEEYAASFPSFRAFLRFYRAIENGEDPEAQRDERQHAPDPAEAAIRLLGLPESFTKDDLKRRFHTLIKGIHPDHVGPNELATLLTNAYTLINERKGWR